MTGIFRTAKLKDLSKKVLIPSFQLDNQAPQAGQRHWKLKFFHNFPGPDSDGEELVVDVALRTSAAPVYFPSYQVYVDGGVVANDPSMAALAQALDGQTGGQALADVQILSIGTGSNPTYIAGHDLDWGVAQWAKPLVNLMIDGVMGVAEYQCARLLGDRYFRLEPQLPKPVGMDDASAVGDLLLAASSVDIAPARHLAQRSGVVAALPIIQLLTWWCSGLQNHRPMRHLIRPSSSREIRFSVRTGRCNLANVSQLAQRR